MDKIKEQANIVSQLLFAGDTGEIYTKTLTRTWDILREIGILLWLVICLTFVGGEWFYRTSVSLGRSARTWYSGLSEKGSDVEPQSIASTGEALLDTVKSGTTYLLSQARQQLGIPEPEPFTPPAPPVKPPSPTPAEPPSPSGPPAPVEPSVSAEPTTPTATILPSAESDEDDLV
jgi:hypothetical protein